MLKIFSNPSHPYYGLLNIGAGATKGLTGKTISRSQAEKLATDAAALANRAKPQRKKTAATPAKRAPKPQAVAPQVPEPNNEVENLGQAMLAAYQVIKSPEIRAALFRLDADLLRDAARAADLEAARGARNRRLR